MKLKIKKNNPKSLLTHSNCQVFIDDEECKWLIKSVEFKIDGDMDELPTIKMVIIPSELEFDGFEIKKEKIK